MSNVDNLVFLLGFLLLLAGGLVLVYVSVGWGVIGVLFGMLVVMVGGWLRWRREMERED